MSPKPIWRSDFSHSKIDFKITLTSIWPHFSLLLECSLHLRSFAACFPHSRSSASELTFSSLSSLSLCFPLTLLCSGVVEACTIPWGSPGSLSPRDLGRSSLEAMGGMGVLKAGVWGCEMALPAIVCGFLLDCFWYILAYHTKGLQPRHTLINDNNRDNRQTNTTFLHEDRSNSNSRLNTWSPSSHLQTSTPRSRNFKSCSSLLLKVALYQHKREIVIKRYRLTLDRS